MSIEDVRTLVAERQRYDDWLASLEAKRTDTPVRVFERVYGDYSARRSAVVDRLREHIGALASLGDELDARSQALETELAAHEDERAEAMLRTAVGEFDADRWELVRQEVEANIATLETQRDELRAEIEDVRSLLASARCGHEDDVAETVVDDAVVDELAIADAAIADAAIADAAPTEEQADGSSELTTDTSSSEESIELVAPAPDVAPVLDETPVASATPSFLSALVTPPSTEPTLVEANEPIDVGEPTWLLPQPAAAVSSEPKPVSIESIAAGDDLDGTDFDDALALFSPSPRQPVDEPAPSEGRSVNLLDQYETDDALAERALPTGSTVPSGDATNAEVRKSDDASRDPFDDLAFLRSVIDPATQGASTRSAASGEQQKTLRCTECGTMNFPTEWYCERCGGELAAF